MPKYKYIPYKGGGQRGYRNSRFLKRNGDTIESTESTNGNFIHLFKKHYKISNDNNMHFNCLDGHIILYNVSDFLAIQIIAEKNHVKT